MRLVRRVRRGGQAAAYLLAMLATALATVLALPLLCLPAVRQSWARWHQTQASGVRRVPVAPHPLPLPRYLAWLAVHVATAVPVGVVALVCVGNLLVAAVVTPLWWAFPADDPPRLLVEVPVTSWGAALTLGLSQLLVLGGFAGWVLPLLAEAHARLSLAMLAPSAADRLAVRVAELSRTRSDVLEAHGAELRRIEQDLHDTTQAQLVAIATRLAVAREALPDGPPIVARVLTEAQDFTEQAMVDLREVLRSIYPPILADRGLPGALRTVAGRAGVPTAVEVRDIGQIPAAIEAVAYFTVTEALTNIAKHSRATQAVVRVGRAGDRLTVTITDNGVGGAEYAAGAPGGDGTGLVGIRRRVHALDGTITLASPTGGPTVITVEIPCG